MNFRPARGGAAVHAPLTSNLHRVLVNKHYLSITAGVSRFTFDQLLQAGDLPASVQRVQRPDPLGKVDVVREGPCELHEESVQGPEAVVGHGIHQTFEVFVSIAVKSHFPGFLLRCEGLQSACAVETTMRAVRRAGDHSVTFGARLRPGVGPRRPVGLFPLFEMFKLDTSAERHVAGLLEVPA